MANWFETLSKEHSVGLKLLLIGVLTLALLIPLAMVEGLIDERSWRNQEVLRDIASQQGGVQRVIGPLIVVPIVRRVEREVRDTESGEMRRTAVNVDDVAVMTPKSLNVAADAKHEMRRRGVYEAPVYRAGVDISGSFAKPNLKEAIPNLEPVDWTKAAVVVGVTDLVGLADATSFDIGGQSKDFRSGAPAYAASLFSSDKKERAMYDGERPGVGAIHAPLEIGASEPAALEFKMTIALNGSGGFFLSPIGRDNKFTIKGDWPHPSFQGAPLPSQPPAIDAQGFEAKWSAPGLARGYGEVWYGPAAERQLRVAVGDAVGFRHARPDDFYNAARRSVKYGVLFVALTFLACFVIERFSEKRLHAAQYGLIGLSLALFYLLFLALAERIGLLPSYAAAAAAIVCLNGAYVWAATRSFRNGLGAGGALALLYAAFYLMLASEDDALLIGAGLLLAGVALAMAATARMGQEPDAKEAG